MTRPSPRSAPSRRDLLHGGAGLLGLLGLGLPAHALAGKSRRLLIWWNGGGWDPSYVFDPHFESAGLARDPTSTAASVGGIDFADSERRPSVRAFFEAHGSRSCIVNGLAVGSISHDACSRLTLTGLRAGGPDVAAIVAASRADTAPLPYIALGGPRYPGALGAVMTPVGPTLAGVVRDAAPGAGADPAQEEALLDYLEAEAADRLGASARADGFAATLARLRQLRSSADLLEVPDDPTAQQRVDLGLRLFEAGLCPVLALEAPLPDRIAWDSHSNNDLNQAEAFESSFAALLDVVDALAAARLDGQSLLDQTTILVLSEMGRTPVLNVSGGKDHWPYTSAMLVGAGVGGGRVVGVTDETLSGQLVDLSTGQASKTGVRVEPRHLLAGLLEGFDVDPGPWFPDTPAFTAWRG